VKLLVYGAGVTGSMFAARLHEAGQDVSLLARGERLAALRRHGVQLAEEAGPVVRRVPVPVVEHPAGGYDLIAVLVRAHQVDAVLESLAGVEGDVAFLLNWAAGAEPLGAVIGPGRVLLGAPTDGGTMDGDVVRYRATNLLTRRVPMSIGEPDGRATPRLDRIVRTLRAAGINAKAEPRMAARLTTHATFAVPLGQAAYAAGGPVALAADPDAVRAMLSRMRQNLAALPEPPVPRGYAALQTLPEGLLVAALRRFLRSRTVAYSGLANTSPAETDELERLAEQLRAGAAGPVGVQSSGQGFSRATAPRPGSPGRPAAPGGPRRAARPGRRRARRPRGPARGSAGWRG
jgi:2-dehydropantoate 2-reductase